MKKINFWVKAYVFLGGVFGDEIEEQLLDIPVEHVREVGLDREIQQTQIGLLIAVRVVHHRTTEKIEFLHFRVWKMHS